MLYRSNTYPERMSRFESFLKEAKELGLDNLVGTDTIPNKHALLFDYYCTTGEKEKALEHYPFIRPEDLVPGQVRRHKVMTGAAPQEALRTIDDYIATFVNRADRGYGHLSLSWMIENFEGARIYSSDKWNEQVHPIKSNDWANYIQDYRNRPN